MIDSGSSMNNIFARSCFFESGMDDAVEELVGGRSVFAEGNAIGTAFAFAAAAVYVDCSLRLPIFERRYLILTFSCICF